MGGGDQAELERKTEREAGAATAYAKSRRAATAYPHRGPPLVINERTQSLGEGLRGSAVAAIAAVCLCVSARARACTRAW